MPMRGEGKERGIVVEVRAGGKACACRSCSYLNLDGGKPYCMFPVCMKEELEGGNRDGKGTKKTGGAPGRGSGAGER